MLHLLITSASWHAGTRNIALPRTAALSSDRLRRRAGARNGPWRQRTERRKNRLRQRLLRARYGNGQRLGRRHSGRSAVRRAKRAMLYMNGRRCIGQNGAAFQHACRPDTAGRTDFAPYGRFALGRGQRMRNGGCKRRQQDRKTCEPGGEAAKRTGHFHRRILSSGLGRFRTARGRG